MFRVTVLMLVSTAACALATSGCVDDPEGDADTASDCGGWIPQPPEEDDIELDGVRIRNPATNRCLTVVPGELFAMATGCSVTSPFQRWDVLGEDDSPFEILSIGLSDSLDADICLTIGVPEAGAEPTLNPCDGSASQAWDVSPLSGRPWEVTISNEDQFLEAGSGGPNVIVSPFASLARQRWLLSP